MTILMVAGEALRLINNLIEGVPVGQRQAQARIWFWVWWPLIKRGLKSMAEVTDSELAEIEKMVGKT